MKTFSHKVFIGVPRNVVNKACDELNKEFNKHDIMFMVTGNDFNLELEMTVEDNHNENEIFQIGVLIGSKMTTAFNTYLRG